MERKKRLRSDPAKTREWQERSRAKAVIRARGKPRNVLRDPQERTPREQAPKRTDGPRDAVPAAVRRQVRERSRGYCEARLDGCTGDATHMHHRLRRRAGVHNAENLVHLCAADHAYVHAHPGWSYTVGLLARSHEGPPAAAWGREQLDGK